MNKNRIVAGIELGSSKITTLIAQVADDANQMLENGSVNVVGVASVPSGGIKKGQIVDIEEAVEGAIASIEGAERMAGYNLDSAYIALGGASVLSQNSHGVVAVSDPEGEISLSDVDRVIEAASAISLPSSREIIHVIPRDYTVDGETGVKDPVGMSGIRLEVETHIVTISSASLKNARKAIDEMGVNIEGVVFNGIAAAEAVLTSTEKELGCVLVDIGGGTTSIATFKEGTLCYSGVIPIGAKNVTNDLAIGLRVSLESAEKIKVFLSSDEKEKDRTKKSLTETDEMDLAKVGVYEVKKVSRKTLVEGIIRPRLNEIFTMVRIQLEKAGVSTSIPAGVVITGGGAVTAGVIDSAKRMLSLPARIGSPYGVSGLIDDIITPAFAVPVGLLKYGAKQSVVEENFMSFTKKIKIPTKGLPGKIIEAIKNLLP